MRIDFRVSKFTEEQYNVAEGDKMIMKVDLVGLAQKIDGKQNPTKIKLNLNGFKEETMQILDLMGIKGLHDNVRANVKFISHQESLHESFKKEEEKKREEKRLKKEEEKKTKNQNLSDTIIDESDDKEQEDKNQKEPRPKHLGGKDPDDEFADFADLPDDEDDINLEDE